VIAALRRNRHRIALWERLRASGRLPSQLLHGDVHAGNVLITPGAPAAFIDFDKMMVGPRIFDLAKYVATSLINGDPTVRLARTALTGFLSGYGGISPLTPAERCCLDALTLVVAAESALVGINYDLPTSSTKPTPSAPGGHDTARPVAPPRELSGTADNTNHRRPLFQGILPPTAPVIGYRAPWHPGPGRGYRLNTASRRSAVRSAVR
jgi:Ser/Thr protein kinase RdoA (MazF antagonist)